MTPSFKFDTAAAISKGARDYQEDAIIADFMSGSEVSIAVLADGMGGHAGGDLASKVVVTEVFRELTFKRDAIADGSANVADVLHGAATAANDFLTHLIHEYPDRAGMGATLLGLLIVDGNLHWISVGDSPLFLYRDNQLTQLNEDHSFGPHIEYLVRSGALTEAEGANHPERNVLTSVLSGQDIRQIDCPTSPFALQAGDTLIVASDGLQFLSDSQIAQVIRDRPLCRSAQIADSLMDEVKGLDHPDLDNVTLLTIQVQNTNAVTHVPQVVAAAANEAGARVWPFSRTTGPIKPRRAVAKGSR